MNILHEVPGTGEYVELRAAAGLAPKEEAVLHTALRNSPFCVVMRDDHGQLLGMGRIIGDRACFFQIVDVLTHPSCEGGEGEKAIMDALMDDLQQQAPQGADILLMADVPSVGFYRKYGFELTYPNSLSMSRGL
ncbi:GNAT family N-acetyltransferase [Paenibacillus melissococcoides]|uniref:GNAT family N-acetyltransferase n=1 Tax=Paenibacillus melissococcoides TaxID=2912268 RepID=A0ABN8U001_9BACL|nr:MULTISPECIES: GNAT family N-acetyltransferase [Paenibacillus]MEB9893398.1 GNAT family N-acetyltransferase [Bacillus cereus]CAH8244379.1 GNAT family N-acetyltransferase [Paenibacillus melissococcoides]CAH8703326.1 GNAT family N-acetyltransferase [Paenibacillus melissococcoides]CAH8705696.1 GNAT family N-acetyltransferase [Paenibacillus melissococcoides]GIO80820.1 N-acetyltransferase [Paenibacillus dendritiformis]